MYSYSSRQIFKAYSCAKGLTTSAQILEDSFGRQHDYLRISLTERCNLRCNYCMPAEGVQLTPSADLLNIDELKRLTNIFVKLCGVSKVRLTGGEPTVDKKLIPLIEHLNTLRDCGLKTIALTTNGLTLKRQAPLYKKLGLNNLNISLDTLREDRFELITRRKGLNLVLKGFEAALNQQFCCTKLNCVVMKNFNEDELIDFANLSLKYPIEVRFIEFMPFAGNRWSSNSLLSYREMFNIISREFPDMQLVSPLCHGGTSKVFKAPRMVGSIGFISSMSEHFCSTCNRIRITADGNLKVCLFGREETSLRDLVRNGARDDEIVRSICVALSRKNRQHADADILRQSMSRPMIKIGG